MRFIAGFQIGVVLCAWFSVIFPDVLFYKNGTSLSLFATAAPSATIHILGWALIMGAISFLPALYYLMTVFKTDPT